MNERTIIEAAIAEDEQKPRFGQGKEAGEQGSVEWLMERVGMITASRFKDVMDFTKAGKPGAKRTAYLWEIVYERLTGKPAYHAVSYAMERGTQLEGMARMAYESRTGAIVEQTGFRKHSMFPFVGGSPDGLIDEDGGCEFKCPLNPQTHLQCWIEGMPDDHIAQVQGLMWNYGRNWWDFGSYNPDIAEPHDLYIERVMLDSEYVGKLQEQIIAFNDEAEAILTKLKEAA